jgi:hypothetical protein
MAWGKAVAIIGPHIEHQVMGGVNVSTSEKMALRSSGNQIGAAAGGRGGGAWPVGGWRGAVCGWRGPSVDREW